MKNKQVVICLALMEVGRWVEWLYKESIRASVLTMHSQVAGINVEMEREIDVIIGHIQVLP